MISQCPQSATTIESLNALGHLRSDTVCLVYDIGSTHTYPQLVFYGLVIDLASLEARW